MKDYQTEKFNRDDYSIVFQEQADSLKFQDNQR